MKLLNDVGRGLIPTLEKSELRGLRVASEIVLAREMFGVVVVAIGSRRQKSAQTFFGPPHTVELVEGVCVCVSACVCVRVVALSTVCDSHPAHPDYVLTLFSCRDTISVVSGYICLSHGACLLRGRFIGHLSHKNRHLFSVKKRFCFDACHRPTLGDVVYSRNDGRLVSRSDIESVREGGGGGRFGPNTEESIGGE